MSKVCFLVDSIFSIGGVQRITAVIAKELTRNYSITIMTFDKAETKDTSLYNLCESPIRYSFINYPQKKYYKRLLCKLFSGFYVKFQPKSKFFSDLYAKSSFPSELRNELILNLKDGMFDVIVGIHAPLAARLATIKDNFPNTKFIGWIHNSFEALFSESSLYIGQERKRHYVYQFRKLDDVIMSSRCRIISRI